MQLCRIWKAKQKNHHFNKKCQQVYKKLKKATASHDEVTLKY